MRLFAIDHLRIRNCFKNSPPVEQVQNKFKFFSHWRALYRWENQIRENGSKIHKLREIWDFVREKFRVSRNAKKIIHDTDLKRWAVQKAKELNFTEFSASDSWVYKFKTAERIVSRKILHFVTSNFAINEHNIMEEGSDFVANTILSIANQGIPDDCVVTFR